MSILDKKHILTINLDDSSIEYSNKIKFYNTDKNISNLYVKIKKTNNDGVTVDLIETDLAGLTLKLAAIKPKTNQFREITGVLTKELEEYTCAIYKFELSSEFTNQVGIVHAQFNLSDGLENGEDVTIDPFAYEIKASKLTGLNAEIISNPDLPILKQLIREVQKTNYIDDENISKFNAYSNEMVEKKINNFKTEVDTQIKESMNQLDELEDKKADVKVELTDTIMCNVINFKLTNNPNYPILQGGCLSDDGANYFCTCITSGGGYEKGIIQKYSVGDITDFSTWEYMTSSSQLEISHANDICYLNNKLYVVNTNNYPNIIHIINPNTLDIEKNISILYGATAITYNEKLNQFVTRRKTERGIFDFYDTDFNYVNSTVAYEITYDTVQGIDSDDSYIYEVCSDINFGSSVVVYDLKGNFIKRVGCNIMNECEHMTNLNGYYFIGAYKNGDNFLSIATLRTDKRLTNGRYKLNQGRNTILTDSNPIWMGDIDLNFSKKYYSHLSFKISVDDVETDTKILDLTDGSTSHIINTYRLTGSGAVIFYRSLLLMNEDSTLRIEPFSFYQLNSDGSRVVKLYSQEPNAFTKTISLGISNIRGQILCGQSIQEF